MARQHPRYPYGKNEVTVYVRLDFRAYTHTATGTIEIPKGRVTELYSLEESLSPHILR